MTETEADRGTTTGAVVEGYFAMWNETDPERRREVITATWAPEARYLDPMFGADSHDGLDRMVAAVHQQFPGHTFRLRGAVDEHHDRVRWAWELAGPDAVVASGVDFAVLAADGRLRDVTGFIEAPTAG